MKTVFTVLGIVIAVAIASLLHPPMESRAACSFQVEVTAPAVQVQFGPAEEQPEGPVCDQTISVAPTEAVQTIVEEPSCSQ